MSYKDDAMAHRVEEQQRAHIVSELRLSSVEMADHPFEVQEDMSQGLVVSWSVYWQQGAPEGIETEGRGGTIWTTIPAPDASGIDNDE